jgi:hypothetical protein
MVFFAGKVHKKTMPIESHSTDIVFFFMLEAGIKVMDLFNIFRFASITNC